MARQRENAGSLIRGQRGEIVSPRVHRLQQIKHTVDQGRRYATRLEIQDGELDAEFIRLQAEMQADLLGRHANSLSLTGFNRWFKRESPKIFKKNQIDKTALRAYLHLKSSEDIAKGHAFEIEHLPKTWIQNPDFTDAILSSGVSLRDTDALEWKQKQHREQLKKWYHHLLNPKSGTGGKPYPAWFRDYCLRNVSLKVLIGDKEYQRHPDTLTDPIDLDVEALKELFAETKTALAAGLHKLPKFHEHYDATRRRLVRQSESFEHIHAKQWIPFTEDDAVLNAQFLADISAGTPWCLKYLSTADTYLADDGILYVYFDSDRNPQIGVHVRDKKILQIRGADDSQHLRGERANILKAFFSANPHKLENIAQYEQQIQDALDIKLLTSLIRDRLFDAPEFDTDPAKKALKIRLLETLYEIHRPFASFGYGRDPQIGELRSQRDTFRDAETFYGKIARTPGYMLLPGIGAYIGELSEEVFQKWDMLGDAKRKDFKMFTRFPDKKIEMLDKPIILGRKTFDDYWQWLQSFKLKSYYAEGMVDPENKKNKGIFKSSVDKNKNGKERKVHLVEVTVGQLFPEAFSTDGSFGQPRLRPEMEEIIVRAKECGLQACDPEIAFEYLQNFSERIKRSATHFGMHPIADYGGDASVFSVSCLQDGALFLNVGWDSNHTWDARARMIFVRE